MTPRDFLQMMRDGRVKRTISLPVPIQIGNADEIAAELLLWLTDKLPDATVGEVDDVLDAAKFWQTFWASANMASKGGE